jgi:hypothetical protein
MCEEVFLCEYFFQLQNFCKGSEDVAILDPTLGVDKHLTTAKQMLEGKSKLKRARVHYKRS